jgi:hypothetical protein
MSLIARNTTAVDDSDVIESLRSRYETELEIEPTLEDVAFADNAAAEGTDEAFAGGECICPCCQDRGCDWCDDLHSSDCDCFECHEDAVDPAEDISMEEVLGPGKPTTPEQRAAWQRTYEYALAELLACARSRL